MADWEIDGGEGIIDDVCNERGTAAARSQCACRLSALRGETAAEFTGGCWNAFNKRERRGIPLPLLSQGYMAL